MLQDQGPPKSILTSPTFLRHHVITWHFKSNIVAEIAPSTRALFISSSLCQRYLAWK